MGSNKFLKRRHNEDLLFQVRSILTSMVSIILRTIEFGQSIMLTLTKRLALNRDESTYPQVMVWLGACSMGITPLVIFNEGIVDHAVFIEKVLPIALKYVNEVLGSDKPHLHYLTRWWCRYNFPIFINSENWPPNNPDLNLLDCSTWDELVNVINCDRVKSKTALIQQIKLLHKRVRESVVIESCVSWTNKLYHMYQNGGKCLR